MNAAMPQRHAMRIDSEKNFICDDNCELVSGDMLNLAIVTIFSRIKNWNFRIQNVGCKNKTYQLSDAEKFETPNALGFL